jgi:hypothetical protein
MFMSASNTNTVNYNKRQSSGEPPCFAARLRIIKDITRDIPQKMKWK